MPSDRSPRVVTLASGVLPTHRPSSELSKSVGIVHVPGALDEISNPVVVALLRPAVSVIGIIVRKSLTPTLRCPPK
jgi:hypothetical protein